MKLAVIRGNAGEIGALSGMGGVVRGVDSVHDLNDPKGVADHLARQQNCVVAITGARDVISDGKRALGVDNGHPMLQNITGSGCMVTAVIAAFCAVEKGLPDGDDSGPCLLWSGRRGGRCRDRRTGVFPDGADRYPLPAFIRPVSAGRPDCESDMIKRAIDYSLYLVTDIGLSRGRTHEAVVAAALRGGVTVVQ